MEYADYCIIIVRKHNEWSEISTSRYSHTDLVDASGVDKKQPFERSFYP
jgi:hypothetical protein